MVDKVLLPTGEVMTPGEAAYKYADAASRNRDTTRHLSIALRLRHLIDTLVENGSLPLDKLLAELPGCVEWEGEGKP